MTEILTDEDIAALNAARTILDRAEDAAQDAAWQASREPRNANAQDYGRFAGAASHAAEAIFSALNVANAYRVQPISDDVLHNRQPAETAA